MYKDINEWKNNLQWLDENEIKKIPSIIIHEYLRIKIILEQNEPYGALLELKDTIEIIIKYYTSIGLSIIYNTSYECIDNDMIKIMLKATEKPLSLGNWAEIIRELVPILQNEKYFSLKSILLGLRKLTTGKQNVVQWRNERLGHGALGYSDSENFQQEFIDMHKRITEFLRAYIEEINCIGFFQKINGKYYELIGNEQLDAIKCDIQDLYYRIDDSEYYSFYPFLSFRKGKVYFFDSFIKKFYRTDLLDYTEGIKEHSKYKEDQIAYDIYNMNNTFYNLSKKRNMIQNEELAKKSSFENPVYLAKYQEQLDDMYKNNRFVPFTEVANWLNNKISTNDKGIYLVYADAGMGKSVCAQQLAERVKKMEILNTTVKVVHINDSTTSNYSLLIRTLEDCITCDEYGKRQLSGIDIPKLACCNIAEFLDKYKELMDEYGEGEWEEKLLLIVDGLDELSKDAIRFFEILPQLDEIENNIFILYLSRKDTEGKNDSNILALEKKCNEIIELKDIVNFDKLKEKYIMQELPNISDELKELFINKINNNLSYLNMIIEMQKMSCLYIENNSNNVISFVNEFRFDKEDYTQIEYICSKYADYLKKIYGEKHVKKHLQVLYLLTNCYTLLDNTGNIIFVNGKTKNRYLSLKEISILLLEENISFELIGILNDLKGILKTIRRKETLYGFARPYMSLRFWISNKDEKSTDMDSFFASIWVNHIEEIMENFENGNDLSENDIKFLLLILKEGYVTLIFKLDFKSYVFSKLIRIYVMLFIIDKYRHYVEEIEDSDIINNIIHCVDIHINYLNAYNSLQSLIDIKKYNNDVIKEEFEHLIKFAMLAKCLFKSKEKYEKLEIFLFEKNLDQKEFLYECTKYNEYFFELYEIYKKEKIESVYMTNDTMKMIHIEALISMAYKLAKGYIAVKNDILAFSYLLISKDLYKDFTCIKHNLAENINKILLQHKRKIDILYTELKSKMKDNMLTEAYNHKIIVVKNQFGEKYIYDLFTKLHDKSMVIKKFVENYNETQNRTKYMRFCKGSIDSCILSGMAIIKRIIQCADKLSCNNQINIEINKNIYEYCRMIAYYTKNVFGIYKDLYEELYNFVNGIPDKYNSIEKYNYKALIFQLYFKYFSIVSNEKTTKEILFDMMCKSGSLRDYVDEVFKDDN